MGYYINPPSGTKEDFLAAHGKVVSQQDALAHDYSSDSLPVCLVNNGAFTAAGIAYAIAEAKAFATPDGRPRQWWVLPKEVLAPYLDKRS